MKKIYYIGAFVLLTLTGCSKFLDKEPYQDPSTQILSDEESAVALVNSAYKPLSRPNLYNLRMWALDIVAGNSEVGAGGGTDGIETIQLANFVSTADNAGVLDIWRGPNPGILYCNTAIEQLPKMKINEQLKNRCLGEARFLRAHYYFILVQLFGDLPIKLTPTKQGDNLYPSRDPKERVYNEVIIPDLQAAYELLPPREQYTDENKGRVSKGSAAGMLAKVYLTLGQYDKALDMCQKVDALGYALNPNYSDNFAKQTAKEKNTVESLFEVQYLGFSKEDFWGNENQASWMSTFMGPRNSGWVGGSYGWNQPTQEFVDQYEAGDKRKDATILYEGGPDFYGNTYKANMSNTGYNVRKFLVPVSISADYNTNAANFVVLRYADVLLMEAEALNELGRTSEAVEPLYKVRARAGLTDKSALQSLSTEEMREKIRHERRMELAFEGHRWFDLIRWDNGDYALNFFHAIGKVNAARKHLLFPIPQKDRDANHNLAQNPGY